jgi:hypothetical protein
MCTVIKSTECSENSTAISSEINETSESVSMSLKFHFDEIYKFNTKLRGFHRNISETGH